MPFTSPSCLLSWGRTSSTVLNENSEGGNPCLVSDHTENTCSFCPLSMMLAVGVSYMVFIMLRYVPSIPTFMSVLIINGCWTFSSAIFVSDGIIICFYPSVFLWCIMLIYLWILYQPCLPGINPTWSWCMIFLMHWWIWFASILLRVFACTFIWDFGL